MGFYLYNLSRDCQDRLTRQASRLGQWFAARASLLTSIVSQKLGLFHNQHFFRPESKAGNPYIGSSSHIETLVQQHGPPPGESGATPSGPGAGLQFRDIYKNSVPGLERGAAVVQDRLGRHGTQLLAIWAGERRELQRKLHLLWQSRGENCNSLYDEQLLQYFRSRARLLHYVFTPLLFLPRSDTVLIHQLPIH